MLPGMNDDAHGRALLSAGEWSAAQAYWSARRPADSTALANLAAAWHGSGRHDLAVLTAQAAIRADERDWAGWGALGNALAGHGEFDAAIAAFAQAVRRAPNHATLLANLAVTCRDAGQPELAIQALDQAIALEPGNAQFLTDRAVALLSAGRLRDGFEAFEQRWQLDDMPAAPFAVPLWRGENPAGLRIGLFEEGGFGDTLQFVRYAPLLAERGARVVLYVRPPLRRLLSQLPGIEHVVSDDATQTQIGPLDRQCSLMSLPAAFGTDLHSVPSASWLHAEPASRSTWADRLDALCDDGLRIGLVWAGQCRAQPHQAAMDRRRSMPLAAMAALAGPGRHLISLQIGPEGAQLPPPGMELVDLTSQIGDFADTAALVANLDVVVAVDTSTAHLTASMGVKVLLLSRYDQCWRWLAGRETSPWYPSLQILRQDRPGDWSGPIARADRALSALRPRLRADRLSVEDALA